MINVLLAQNQLFLFQKLKYNYLHFYLLKLQIVLCNNLEVY